MKPSIETVTRLEIQVVRGPRDIRCMHETIKLDSHLQDAAVLVLQTLCGRTLMSEEIVAVFVNVAAFLRARQYASHDGGVTLSPELA